MNRFQEPKYMIVDVDGNELPHARIANRTTSNVIPDEEPIMIFRGKDLRCPQMIRLYAELCRNPAHQRVVVKRFDDFTKFQTDFSTRCEEPD